MSQIALYFVLVLGGLLLVPVSERLRLPAPVLTTVYGFLVALAPFLPQLRLAPDALLPLVLPPLLYAAARRSSWRRFAAHLRPILVLAIVVVFLTAAAVAAVAATVHPALPLGSAVVLGAIVSPPDAAAVVAIAGRLGLPRRLVTVLEGEGLFNDVVALTFYQVTVAGVVAGSVSVWNAGARFCYAAVVAVVIGLAIGWLAALCFDQFSNARLTTGLSLLVPYAAYVAADELSASGVLAVITTTFYLGVKSADPDDTSLRLVMGSFWNVTELMVTAITFGIVGSELVIVLRAVDDVAGQVWTAILIAAVVIGVRAGWMALGVVLAKLGIPAPERHVDWRASMVAAWSGMRGVVTIVTALALPTTIDDGSPFPGREHIQLVAMVVVVVTLVVQGLTLPGLVNLLGIRIDVRRQDSERTAVVTVAHDAAMKRLTALQTEGQVPGELADRLRGWFIDISAEWADREGFGPEPAERIARRRTVRHCEAELLAAARSALVDARLTTRLDPVLIDEVLWNLDLRSAGRTP